MRTSQWKDTFRDLVVHEECRGFTIADDSGSAIVRGPFVFGSRGDRQDPVMIAAAADTD